MSKNQLATISTHARHSANHVSSRNYQRERMNVFLNPAHKHQIDLLAVEWGVSLVEVVRRLLSKGLESIMLTVPTSCNSERRETNEHQSLA